MAKSITIDGITTQHFLLWLEKWAVELADKPAVKGMGETFTYNQLDKISDAVAEHLISLGVQPSDVVMVEMERHVDVFLAILGTWKARAAFAYVDAVAPDDQKQMLWEDSGAKYKLVVETIEEIKAKVLKDGYVAPDYEVGEIDDLAWILLTSGSTGRSKGVVMYQKNVALHLRYADILGHSQDDVQSMLASFSFMSGLFEGFLILYKGGTLHMIPNESRRNLDDIEKFVHDNDINILFLPAHLAETFIREGRGGPKLRMVLTGGEAIHNVEPPKDYKFYCFYGASETGGPATYKLITENREKYSVGPCFPLLKMYLVMPDGKTLAGKVGDLGEICFAGQVICGGYRNNPELTAEKFKKNPFSDDPNYSILYHTGDLATLNEEGEFEYSCRADLMCKIRSFRIELGEVEGVMKKYPGIDRCVVKPQTRLADGERELHGFYYAPGVEIDHEELRQYMRNNLLHYKAPKYYHRLDSIVVTDNGKINRKAVQLDGYKDD